MASSTDSPVPVVIAGFGFMGQTHAKCLAMNPRAVVAGIVDAEPSGARERADELGLQVTVEKNLGEVLAKTGARAVDICLPTDLHQSYADQAFSRGLHVFCEKPLALTNEDATDMVRGADSAGVFLMVGHCIRFWPEYRELERVVRSGELGALRALSLKRMAGRPAYTVGNWVGDPARCTGAALDLHIHDTDFLHHLLGLPAAVTSRGLRYPSGWDRIATLYDFDGLCVSAEGSWDRPAGWGFRMAYHAAFELGSLDFDSAASPALTRCEEGGKPQPVPPPALEIPHPAGLAAYAAELDYFLSCIQEGKTPQISSGAQAAGSLRLALAEIESAATGKTITL